jgi:hypothetical protein
MIVSKALGDDGAFESVAKTLPKLISI